MRKSAAGRAIAAAGAGKIRCIGRNTAVSVKEVSQMKRIAKDESKCIGCRSCENACSMAYYKKQDPQLSCIRITDLPDGGHHIAACNQCGICASVCNTVVIRPNPKGVYMLNKKECAGCLMCVGFCPQDVMVHAEGALEPSKCTSCGLCVKACPTGAIWMEEV